MILCFLSARPTVHEGFPRLNHGTILNDLMYGVLDLHLQQYHIVILCNLEAKNGSKRRGLNPLDGR